MSEGPSEGDLAKYDAANGFSKLRQCGKHQRRHEKIISKWFTNKSGPVWHNEKYALEPRVIQWLDQEFPQKKCDRIPPEDDLRR